jgi:hypothetical protein
MSSQIIPLKGRADSRNPAEFWPQRLFPLELRHRGDAARAASRRRQFYVDNLQGNLDATLAAANSTTGAVYPPGSVIQLIPGEAMVKRDKGFNAATHDWEFFELDVSKDGTQIRKRGTVDVVNRFGGNCFGCHVPAAAQWDLVCETGHGCAPLAVTRAMDGSPLRQPPNQPGGCRSAQTTGTTAEGT